MSDSMEFPVRLAVGLVITSVLIAFLILLSAAVEYPVGALKAASGVFGLIIFAYGVGYAVDKLDLL